MNELENNYESIGKQIFTNSGKTYVYDFDSIRVEQGEPVVELGKFKDHQDKRVPDTFDEILKSKGADWLIISASYLLLEEKEGIILPFDKNKVEKEVQPFIRNLPIKERSKLKLCIDDFFINIGEQSIFFMNMQSESKRNGIEMLSQLMQIMKP